SPPTDVALEPLSPRHPSQAHRPMARQSYERKSTLPIPIHASKPIRGVISQSSERRPSNALQMVFPDTVAMPFPLPTTRRVLPQKSASSENSPQPPCSDIRIATHYIPMATAIDLA